MTVISLWTVHLSEWSPAHFIKCVQSQLFFPSALSSIIAVSLDSVPFYSPSARSLLHHMPRPMPWSRSPTWPGSSDIESSTAPSILVRHSSTGFMQDRWTVLIAIQIQGRPSLLTCATVHDADHAMTIWSEIRHVVADSIPRHRVHSRWYLLFSKPVVGTSSVDQVSLCLVWQPDLPSSIADHFRSSITAAVPQTRHRVFASCSGPSSITSCLRKRIATHIATRHSPHLSVMFGYWRRKISMKSSPSATSSTDARLHGCSCCCYCCHQVSAWQ